MESALRIVVIIIAVCLIITLLLQAKGTGGGLFGGGTFRTRRGVERLLFRITIILGVSFVVATILAVRL